MDRTIGFFEIVKIQNVTINEYANEASCHYHLTETYYNSGAEMWNKVFTVAASCRYLHIRYL